ncbi:MAG: DEAD/DEAH box helicase [Chloroflexi bacterium]|nr:DEAD/DEAH box helicase [Chloroflexota bacterium]
MYDTVRGLISGPDFSVVESFDIPGSSARHERIPSFLFESKVGGYLEARFGESGLWTHQAEALEALGSGDNVVVSTGTASGKSLVFQALAFHRVLRDPSSRVVVFYPLRALVEDQLRSWQEMARELELDDDFVGRIYGPLSFSEREETLQRSRIIVMTPDVCQAWLMSRLAMPAVRNFLGSLCTVILDEAHTLEGVFGSNFAFLIRRLLAARSHLLGLQGEAAGLQFVAATATIANPGGHLKQLTGSDFAVVDSGSDGAPRYERIAAHIACAEGDELSVTRDLQARLLAHATEGGFITFVDSRKGVETLAMATERDVSELVSDSAVVSYRAGFDPEDRRRIEEQLRTGARRGVVSTSALEMGIDFPHLRVGFNAGIPPTRKQYRQRLGRVARSGPGAFIVIGPPDAFQRYGTSFQEYHDMSVEPSYLYLDNRFMQFAHGRCLADEREALSAPAGLPGHLGWPVGFGEIYRAARPGGNRPPEFDGIAELGGDTPHRGYPLRNVGETNFDIKFNENSDRIGDITQSQALREAYPGATYLHRMQSYEVSAWNASTFSPFIRIRQAKYRRLTPPRITTWINSAITPAELIDNNLRRSSSAFVAECTMQITERVEGYTDGAGDFRSYQELQKKNPNMRARSRNFRTSGVVLCFDHDWFKAASTRRELADRLRELFVHEYSVLPQDVGSSATNITVRDVGGKTWRGRCIAIFDQTYGSLRLTERLYREFDHIIDRLAQAGSGSEELARVTTRIQEERSGLVPTTGGTTPLDEEASERPSGFFQLFDEGSVVFFRQKGSSGIDVEIIEPTIRDDQLMYRVKVPERPGQLAMRRYVPESAVEPSADADAWGYRWWDSRTETYSDPPDNGE